MIAILGIIFILLVGVIYICIAYKSEKFTSSVNNCNRTLTPCVNGECINCPNNFECLTVTEDDNTNLVFNGGIVPIGKWCLPKKSKKNCNRYTGRRVWTADGEQTWKCECLYPRLFGNNSTTDGCIAKYACNNPIHPDTDDNTNPKIGNKLIGTEHAPKELQGEIWDPLYQEKTEVLMANPYTTNKDGKPWFSCQCNSKTAGVEMSRLPDSPYMCHVDQCWLGNKIAGIEAQTDGTVQCDCKGGGGQTIPEGKRAGTCFNVPLACGDGGTWNSTEGMCKCKIGCSVKCGSKQYGLTGDKDVNGKEIMCETNPAGRMCYNMCEEQEPCQNGGTCTPICTEAGPDFSCICTTDTKTQRYFTGKDCSDFCYTAGHQCSSEHCDSTPVGQHCYCQGDGCTKCCNGIKRPDGNDGAPCVCK
jgi:hypothetical protein